MDVILSCKLVCREVSSGMFKGRGILSLLLRIVVCGQPQPDCDLIAKVTAKHFKVFSFVHIGFCVL